MFSSRRKYFTNDIHHLGMHDASIVCQKRLKNRTLLFVIVLFFLMAVDQISAKSRNDSATIKRKKRKDLTKLRVGITHRPDDCKIQSKRGDYLIIHYNATVYPIINETVDSSYDREVPFRFQLGNEQVIPGLEKGLFNMCLNEHRKLLIPSDFAYGNVGAGHKIPPDSTLIYNVELLKIVEGHSDEGKKIAKETWYEDVQF